MRVGRVSGARHLTLRVESLVAGSERTGFVWRNASASRKERSISRKAFDENVECERSARNPEPMCDDAAERERSERRD